MFFRKLFSYFKQTVKKMFIIMDIAFGWKLQTERQKNENKTFS